MLVLQDNTIDMATLKPLIGVSFLCKILIITNNFK